MAILVCLINENVYLSVTKKNVHLDVPKKNVHLSVPTKISIFVCLVGMFTLV